MVVVAFFAIAHYSWSNGLLHWALHPSIAETTQSWESNGVVRDAADIANKLSGGLTLVKAEILAGACLIVRFIRVIPGWLSLPVSFVAAFFGVLLAIIQSAILAAYWPVTAGLLIISWIIVANTRR